MPGLKEVKNRIESVTSTQQITKAMKMVATAKLRKAQNRILQLRPYFQKLSGVIENVLSSAGEEGMETPYANHRPVNNVLLVVIASDRGLCGAFNNNVFKYTGQTIDKKYRHLERSGNIHVLPVGKRAYDYFKKRTFKVIDGFHDLFSRLSFEAAKAAAQLVMDGFVNERYDKVEIIYNEFKNIATQVLRCEPFLPIAASEERHTDGIDYIFEPSEEVIFEEIIPKSLRVQFYKAVLESNASEHGARMTAMDQATDNAAELLKELKLAYNRTRQAAITKEISEIVGGAEALSH